jgi:hypothetical protein
VIQIFVAEVGRWSVWAKMPNDMSGSTVRIIEIDMLTGQYILKDARKIGTVDQHVEKFLVKSKDNVARPRALPSYKLISSSLRTQSGRVRVEVPAKPWWGVDSSTMPGVGLRISLSLVTSS